MKTQALIMLLLLLICTAIFASENPNEAEEYERKTQELNERAARFKAETGFKGDITHNGALSHLGIYRGNFPDIPFAADADSSSFRNACNMILTKILPYTLARRSQLSMSRITNNFGIIHTDYIQMVSGYRVESGGLISISFDKGKSRFSISNGTVELPSNAISPIISYEEAVRIAKRYYIEKLGYTEDIEIKPATNSIAFVNLNNHYELCYVLGIPDPDPNSYKDFTIIIDATNGIIRDIWDLMSPLDCHVSGKIFPEATTDFTVPTTCSMVSVEVQNVSCYYYSDENGNCIIDNLVLNDISSRLRHRNTFFVTVHPSETTIKMADRITSNGNSSVLIEYDTDYANSANVFFHINKQLLGLNNLSVFTPNNMRITTGVYVAGFPNFGTYSPSANLIRIREDKSKYSHVIRHELSHAFIYNKLSGHWFRDGDYNEFYCAMDESFAHYLPCTVCDSPNAIMGLTSGQAQYENISSITSFMVKDFFWPIWTLDEEMYSFRYFDYALASAWWSLRNNRYFPNDAQNRNGVDTLLVAGLEEVRVETIDHSNDAYRYKPRYFYNILMSRVDDDSSPWPLNDKQSAIDEAYRTRGFHFTPKVISAGVSNPPEGKEKNNFRIGDPIYVEVTNCPQNTPLTIYIVEDQDYTDGMSIGALSILCSQIVTAAEIGADGKWSGVLCNSDTLGVGDYDILVDIGNNGVLHFAYLGANIRDGFDGLDGKGFTVYDDQIEVVLALDKSYSMIENMETLRDLTRSFISAMSAGDKVNIFAFNEGDPPIWTGGRQNIFPTPESVLYEITEDNHSTMVESVPLLIGRGATDLSVPFTYGRNRFGSLSDRNKGMVLLSDGLHTPSSDSLYPNDPELNNPHTMETVIDLINSDYCPALIKCYTMRFDSTPPDPLLH